jgi:hypothetical protein
MENKRPKPLLTANYIEYEGLGGKKMTPEQMTRAFIQSYTGGIAIRETFEKHVISLGTIPFPPTVEIQPVPAGLDYFVQQVENIYNETLAPESYIRLPIMNKDTVFGPFKSEQALELSEAFDKAEVPYTATFVYDGKKVGKVAKTYTLKGVEKKYVNIVIKFPYPAPLSRGNRIIRYIPQWTVIGYDKNYLYRFYDRLTKGKFGDKLSTERAVALYKELVKIVETFYFGSGTPGGLLTRMKAMSEARNAARTKRKAAQKGKDQNARAQAFLIFVRSHTFKDPSITLPDLTDTRIPAQIRKRQTVVSMGSAEFKDVLYTFNLNSTVGPLYYRVDGPLGKPISSKRELLLIDQQLGTEILNELHDRAPQGQQLTTPEVVKEFYKKYPWINLFILFGKSEVYKRSERFTKTRGIASYSSVFSLLCSVACQPVFNIMKDLTTSPPMYYIPGTRSMPNANLCLLGFSPFYGGIGWIMEAITALQNQPDGTHWVGVYADNFYIAYSEGGNTHWHSLDCSKAESTISDFVVGVAAKYILTSYTAVDTAWRRFMEIVYPNAALHGVAVIQNQQFKWPAMGSGVVGTAFNNTLQLYENIMLTDQGALKKKVTYPYVKEGKIAPTLAGVLEVTGTVLTEELYTIYKGDETHVKLDLLGFDAFLFENSAEDARWIPVLDRDRMLKLLVFNKKYHDAKGVAENDFVASFHKLIKFKSALMLGAWTDPTMYKDLTLWCIQLHAQIKDFVGDYQEAQQRIKEILSAHDLPLDVANSIAAAASNVAVPTLYELVLLATGDVKFAERAVALRREIFPLNFLIPEEMINLEKYPDFVKAEEAIEHGITKDLSFDITAVAFPEKEVLRSKQLAKEIFSKQTEHREPAKPKLRMAPTKDVGTPTLSKKPTYASPKVQEMNKWLNRLSEASSKGLPIIYRIPINERYIHALHELENPVAVIRATVKSLLTQETGSDELSLNILKKLPLIYFTILPLTPAFTAVWKGKVYYSPIETSLKALTPNKLFSRTPRSPETELGPTGTLNDTKKFVWLEEMLKSGKPFPFGIKGK